MAVNLFGTPGSYFTAGFGGSGTSPLDLGSYTPPQVVNPTLHPCIILVVNYEAAGAGFGPYAGVLGMTYGGVPMTISEAPRTYSPTPYGDTHSSFIAMLPFDGSTVFSDNHFRFIAGPTLTFLGVNGAFAGVATDVDPAAIFDQLVLTNPLTSNAPITLTMSAITGTTDDMLVGFVGEGVGTTSNAWVAPSSPTFQIENGSFGSENVCAFYRALTTTETSGVTVVSGTDTTPYVGALGGWLFRLKAFNPNVTVPNVVGESLTTAEADIVAAGCTVGTLTAVPGGTPGLVTIQSPVGGTIVAAGSPVDLTYDQGVAIPNVINTSLAVATSLLAAAGFPVGVPVTHAPDVLIIAGNVDLQSPAAGTFATPGTPVFLQLSTGRAGAVVPDIIGLTEAEAIAAIISVGLAPGAINFALNDVIGAPFVCLQNPEPGIAVMYGSLVSFTISLGSSVEPPYKLVQSDFKFDETVISQYQNSPTLLQLVENMDAYLNQQTNMQTFYDFVWNVDTAQGFGLDIWGKIVNVSRLLYIPVATPYVGFQDGSSAGPGPGWDVEPFGRANPPTAPTTLGGGGGEGTWFLGAHASQSYILPDASYRKLILVKALANIVATTVPALNQLLRNLFVGRGNPYVQNNLDMTMVFVFDFALTPIELAILEQSNAVPVPPGVSFTISVPP